MVSRIAGRILHVIYPVLILGFVLTAWGSSSLSDVRMTPPAQEQSQLFWSPVLSPQVTCSKDTIQDTNRSCAVSNESKFVELFSNNQAKNKTN